MPYTQKVICRTSLRWHASCRVALQRNYAQRDFASLRQSLPGRRWRTLGVRDDEGRKVWYEDEGIEMSQAIQWLQQSILPRGYPESVSKGYMSYIQWTAVSLLTGRIQSVLATQAALFAIGLGKGAIPMAAAVQWILKDGVGHAAAILYASVVNTKFDTDAKRYRFQATLALTFADFVSIGMPLYPQYFLFLASLSSAISSMANLAQMASRARIQASFAQHGNLADCARCGQTQAKLMGLLGTGLGAGLSWIIGPSPLHVFGCMIPLACISVYGTYKSSQLIVLKSLNLQRTERIFRQLLHELTPSIPGDPPPLLALSPTEVADEETFCYGEPSIFRKRLVIQPLIGASALGRIGRIFGSSQARILDTSIIAALLEENDRDHSWIANWSSDYRYVIAFQRDGIVPLEAAPIYVWYQPDAKPVEKLQAVWHCCVIRHLLEFSDLQVEDMHSTAQRWWPGTFDAVERQGWAVDRVFLDGAEASLNINHSSE